MPPFDEVATDLPRPIRLPEAERDSILDRLDEADGRIDVDGVILLKGNRATWRKPAVLTVEHPGGGAARFEVWTRWISADRLGVIHRGFLHPRTPCSVRIANIWDGQDDLAGSIAACEHVQGLIHRVDIAVRGRVDLWKHLEKGPTLTKLTCRDVASVPLEGRILHIESEVTVHKTVAYLLRETRLRIHIVPSVGAALDEAKRIKPQIIMMDAEVDGRPADEVVLALQAGGVTAPVLLVTGETHPGRIGRAKAAGVTAVVELPCASEALIEAIRPWLPTSPTDGADMLTSALSGRPEAQPMLEAYLDRLSRWREELHHRTSDADLDAVRRACLGIKATAQTVGFEALHEAAKRAVVALDASMSVVESQPVLGALVSVISRIRHGGA